MKKFLLITILLSILCVLQAEFVDFDRAAQAAQNWLSYRNGLQGSNISPLLKEGYSHTSGDLVIFYTFSFEPGGFVIMAADDASIPVLGYSIHGNANPEDLPGSFASLITAYERSIREISAKQLSNEDTLKEWNRLLNNEFTPVREDRAVEPLLATNWHQNSPWNLYCPSGHGGPGGRAWAGCVAVAMAQVTRYWSYPYRGSGSHSYYHDLYGVLSANFEETIYEWSNMPNNTSTASTALLLYHLGVSVEMYYGSAGSGAQSSDVRDALVQHFYYHPDGEHIVRSDYTTAAWMNILKDQLDIGLPLYYSGGGHAFNCDGYDEEDYFHFNCGWSGNYNGYYHINSLNPGGSNFNANQEAVINLYPGGPNVNPPLSFTAIAGDGYALLEWDEPEPSARASDSSTVTVSGQNYSKRAELLGFNIYRDNLMINSELVTTTDYQDDDVENFTLYEYYVTALYDAGESIRTLKITVEPTDIVYIWQEDFNPPGTGWTLQGNWSFEPGNQGHLKLNSHPAELNYDMTAVTEEIPLPMRVDELKIRHGLMANNAVDEVLQIIIMHGSEETVLWSYQCNAGNLPAADHVFPIDSYAGETIRIKLRSFGSDTTNLWYWLIYHIEVIQLPYVLPVPQNLIAEPGNGLVSLNWHPPAEERFGTERNLLGYNVYRSAQQINPFTVSDTVFTDEDVVNEQTYNYYVTALYSEGESEPSNSAAATPTSVVLLWQEDFDPPMEGWSLTGNWFFELDYLWLYYHPVVNNFDMQAISPEIELPANVGNMTLLHDFSNFSAGDEVLEISLLIGEEEIVLWSYDCSDGSFSLAELTIPISPFQGVTARLKFRSFGSSTNNINYWKLLDLKITTLPEDLLTPEIISAVIDGDLIGISWESVPAANSYKIYASSDPYLPFNDWEFVASLPSQETTFSEVTQEIRFYRVIASTEAP
jgi:hypothetical protein